VYDFDLLTPHATAELAQMLTDTHGRILAGGTDLILFMESGRLRPATVIDISRVRELHYLRSDAGSIHLGPLVTHSEVMASPLLREWAPILPMAAATIGAAQIRNRGTIGGNVGTASPAGDLIPALMALGASLTLCSVRGERRMALDQFMVGPGKTVLAADEYIAGLDFATPPFGARGAYYKAARRKAQAISLVSVGVQMTFDAGRVASAHICLGAVAPVVMHAVTAENALRGQRLTDDLCQQAAQLAANDASPITDVRASAVYRRSLVQTWVRRALQACL
jgi:CO/xanthine dehydrogenase FAD-binding subunit